MLISTGKTIDEVSYFKHQTKYVLFRYLPYPLKKYLSIEKLNFNIESDNSEIADFANQLVDLDAKKEEIEHRIKLYEEKYSETIGALSDDSFGNHKKK